MRSPSAYLAGIFASLLTPCVAISLALVSPTAHAQDERPEWLDIELGKSMYLETPQPPTSVAITNPKVASVQPLGSARKFQVQGKAIGTTDLLVTFGPGVPPITYDVTVHRDLTELIRRVDSIVEGEAPRVYPLEDRIVVQGPVEDLDTLEQVALVARIYDEDFVNLMQVRGDHQVQLEVLFAEVSRSAIREMGLNVLFGTGQLGGGMLQGGSGVGFQNPALSSLLNPPVISTPSIGGSSLGIGFSAALGAINLVTVAQLLDEYTMGKILAQPTLVSLSGQQAELLAGGQVPIPQPTGQGGQIAIVFKNYGVHLTFVPTVLANNVIDIRMTVEISEIDRVNVLPIAGLQVPGFITRKADSHLRIESGKTFALAGLLNESSSFTRRGVPGLGRLPILGMFFRNIAHVRNETEVVIYVTPRLVRPLASNEVPPPPGTTENNNPSDVELYILGTAARPGSRTAEPTGAVGLQR